MVGIYKIHQIVLDDDLVDLINKEGWNCHVKAVAYSQASMNGDTKIGVMHDCYTHVADIIADDLDHVFEAGNIGPEDRITRHDRMHSISVGDIIEDPNGVKHVVAQFGFEQLA
jgi:hypothetical protein